MLATESAVLRERELFLVGFFVLTGVIADAITSATFHLDKIF
mgnify:CR=1 FL=1